MSHIIGEFHIGELHLRNGYPLLPISQVMDFIYYFNLNICINNFSALLLLKFEEFLITILFSLNLLDIN